MAAEPVFVDTNVLVYATRRPAAEHGRALAALNRLDEKRAEVWISRQVLREYLVAVTRPQATALPITAALATDPFARERYESEIPIPVSAPSRRRRVLGNV